MAGPVSRTEWIRYADPATELTVVRLTNPLFESGLTAPHLRQFTRRGETLLYWSTRDGSRQAQPVDYPRDERGPSEKAALALEELRGARFRRTGRRNRLTTRRMNMTNEKQMKQLVAVVERGEGESRKSLSWLCPHPVEDI